MKSNETTYARLNITLPRKRVGQIDRVRGTTNRSRFIDEAVQHYIASVGKGTLRKLIREGALRNQERDLGLVEEWFRVDAEAWPGARRK